MVQQPLPQQPYTAAVATLSETLHFVWHCDDYPSTNTNQRRWKTTRLLFVMGGIGGIIHGLAWPLMAYVLSQTFQTISQISTQAADDTNITNDHFEDPMAEIRRISITFLVVGFYSLAAAFWQTTCFELAAVRATKVFQLEWFRALIRQDAAFFDVRSVSTQNTERNNDEAQQNKDTPKSSKKKQPASSSTVIMSPESIIRYQQGVGRKLGDFIQNATTGVAGLALAIYNSWRVALLVVFAILPIIAAASFKVTRLTQTKTARGSRCYQQAAAVASSTLSSLPTILSLNAVPRQVQLYQQATQHAFDNATRGLVSLGFWNGMIMASILGLFVGVILFGSFVMYRELRENGCNPEGGIDACENTGADIFGATMGILFAGQAISQVGNSLEALGEARIAVAEALKVMTRTKQPAGKRRGGDDDDGKEKKEQSLCTQDKAGNIEVAEAAVDIDSYDMEESRAIETPSSNIRLPRYAIDPLSDDGATLDFDNVKGELELRNCTFAYPTRPSVPILRNCSMIIPAGKTVALVGPSGGGKSTVLSMIERFYDPLKGQVCLDGQDITQLNLSDYRKVLGYVGQEPALFSTTIGQNIAFGASSDRSDAVTQNEIESAAKMANAHDFIMSLPDGYNTQVGDKGAQLSGGQKQRVAIARTLVTHPRILCLDEATSALDAESELHVQEALDRILETSSMTAIIVAHRLSTIRKADIIFVISYGGVVERGTHAELMDCETSLYRSLVEKQEAGKNGKRAISTRSSENSLASLDSADCVSSDEKPESPTPSHAMPLLAFRNVSFAYPSRPTKSILQNFNLSVMEGETLALVGPSGGGKSTTVGLIERFYDPTGGMVEYKGDDVTKLNPASYRNQIGYVGQEPILFAGTIASNIAFGETAATHSMIEEAAKQANIHDFIMKLPNKYHTQMGDTSTQISGGQKQRVAIARALIKKPPILLLDEATSALDIEAEGIVQEALDKLMRSRDHTVIVIAHKLATIQECADRIAVIGDGTVLEVGTHEELLATQHGHFKRLVMAQQRGTTLTSLGIKRSNTSISNQESSEEKNDLAQEEHHYDDVKEALPNSIVRRIKEMTRPDLSYMVVGSIGAVLSGACYPLMGVLFAATIDVFFFAVVSCKDDAMSSSLGFDTCSAYWDDAANNMQSKSFEVSRNYAILIATTLFGAVILYWGFGQASERLSKRVRDGVFKSLARQEVGFFDCNNIGELKSRLQESTARLHAFSGAPARQFLLAMSSLLVGLILSFVVMWPYALLCIACMIPVAYGARLRNASMRGEDEGNLADTSTSAGAIMAETLLHMKTIAALGLERKKIESFEAAIIESQLGAVRKSALSGVMSGMGNFIQRCSNAVLYFWGGYLLLRYPEHYGFSDFLIAQFAFMFSTLGLAAALQDLDDRKEVEASAKWIFSILDRKSKIDPLSGEGKKLGSLDLLTSTGQAIQQWDNNTMQSVEKDGTETAYG